MTAYFDEKTAKLRDIANRFAAHEECSDTWHAVLADLFTLDRSIVWDVSVCAEMPGFPPALRDAIARVVLAHSVGGQPVNSRGLDFELTEQHVEHIARLICDLHTIYHDVGRGRLERPDDRFDDDPRTPLRCLYAQAEDLREQMVEASGRAIEFAQPANITFDDSSVTAAQTVTATIKSEAIQVAWLVGETDVQAATKLVLAINAATDRLPVTVANGPGPGAGLVHACGRPFGECGRSTGICGRLTFGVGDLDDYGYWTEPCAPCARAWEQAHGLPDGACWPSAEVLCEGPP